MGRFLATGLYTIFLLACASGPEGKTPTIQIEGMVIENQTQAWVSAARLLVPVTGNFVSCGNITPGTMCSTTFPETSYTGNPVEITWSQGGQIHSTGQFILQIPEQLDKARPAVVRIVITGPTSAGAVLVQSQE
jgi:hypothetical protein